MASLHPPSASVHHPVAGPHSPAHPNGSGGVSQAVSPPSRQNLRSWWKTFSRGPGKSQDTQGTSPQFYYNPLFKEGPMNQEVPVADRLLDQLFDQSFDASNDGSRAQYSPPRTTRSGSARMSPYGRQRSTASRARNCLAANSLSFPLGRSVATALFAIKELRNEHRASLVRKITDRSKIASEPSGIFGVPLRQSITYANVAISLVDAEGKSYIYGYVPIVVAKCGVYLKEKATNVEGIFRLSGAEKRIKELVVIFNSPDRYGKGLDWDGYTVHDAANVLRRYLNQLPEPIVPLDLYDRFREPLRGHALEAVGDQDASQASDEFNLQETIIKYQRLITELPPLNRQLLLYILDLLAVFASKSDENRMTSQNLAAIFQPGMLSHPAHDMAPAEYRLSQDVLVFLIENQDHFLIGMRGTAADEKTVQDVQNGSTPPVATPTTPNPNRGKNAIGRSASNASAGADSLRRQGGVRRNVSVNSRHSRQSNGAPSPASPAIGQPLSQSPSGGVHRSNTVPSKRSPAIGSNRLQKSFDARSTNSPGLQPTSGSPSDLSAAPVVIAVEQEASPTPSPGTPSNAAGTLNLYPTSNLVAAGQSQDKLLQESTEVKPGVSTPIRDRNIFQRSPTAENDRRPQNKLRKKRAPGSSNPSAQSSTNSLPGQSGSGSPAMPTAQPNQDIAEYPHLASIPSGDPTISRTDATPVTEQPPALATLPMPITRQEDVHRWSDGTLKPQQSSHSLGSREESMNEQSDMEPTDDPVVAAEQKEKRRRWRLSRKKDDTLGANLASPKKSIGANGGAETSTTSFNSSRGRKSFTADTIPAGSDSGMAPAHQLASSDSGPSHDSTGRDKEDKKGPIDWIKRKMQEAKEEKRERDAEKEKERAAKGFPSERRRSSGEPPRGKSMDVRRSSEKVVEGHPPPPA